jgi:hypothetical protein
MFDSEPYSLSDLPALDASEADKDQQWRVWVAKEIQHRALLGHYELDGLISRMSGRPTSVRHAANQLSLPTNEAAFEASTPHEWLSRMHSQNTVQSSFRSIFSSLFLLSKGPCYLDYAYSVFSLRVILEGLQSLVLDCDNDDVATVGVPMKIEVRKVLIRVYEIIANSAHLSNADRLEILLRWHSICLDICVDSSLLCKYVCSCYGIAQHIWGGVRGAKLELDLTRWVNTEDARKSLLHAVAIQEIVEQLPRGRANVLHIPSSLFASATVYIVFSLAGLTQVNLPSVVDWKDVLASNDDPCAILAELSNSAMRSETMRYICGEYPLMFGEPGAMRNLLYELNSMQKLFRCLSSQWGVAYDMEEIMDQWITVCH